MKELEPIAKNVSAQLNQTDDLVSEHSFANKMFVQEETEHDKMEPLYESQLFVSEDVTNDQHQMKS